MERIDERSEGSEGTVAAVDLAGGGSIPVTPADGIRSAVAEAEARGAPMVSAQALQAKLFGVYDDARAEPAALELVQRHLALTLERTWYSGEEVSRLADQLDWLLGLAAVVPGVDVPAE